MRIYQLINPSKLKRPFFKFSIKKQQEKDFEIEEMKPTAIQIKARRDDIMMKKKIIRQYNMLDSKPTDNVSQIESNYIELKKTYNDRHCTIPNKKQFLINLDRAYDHVMEIHEDYNYSIMPDHDPKDIREAITKELEGIKKYTLLTKMQTPQFAALILFISIIIMIGKQEYYQTGERFKLTNNYLTLFALKEGVVSNMIYSLNKIKSLIEVSPQKRKELERKIEIEKKKLNL